MPSPNLVPEPTSTLHALAELNAALAILLAAAILARWGIDMTRRTRISVACCITCSAVALALALWVAADASGPSQAASLSPKPQTPPPTDANTASLLKEIRAIRATLVVNLPQPNQTPPKTLVTPTTKPPATPTTNISVIAASISRTNGRSAPQLNLSLKSDPPGLQLQSADARFCLANTPANAPCLPGIPNKSCPADLICPADTFTLTATPVPRRATIPHLFLSQPGPIQIHIETANGKQLCVLQTRPGPTALVTQTASCAPETAKPNGAPG